MCTKCYDKSKIWCHKQILYGTCGTHLFAHSWNGQKVFSIGYKDIMNFLKIVSTVDNLTFLLLNE